MKKLIPILFLTVAAVMLSSCVIIHPDDETDFCIEEKKEKKSSGSSSSTKTSTTTQSNPVQNTKFTITFKNNTDYVVNEWFIRKDNISISSNSGYVHPICPHDFDAIRELSEGQYRIWFIISDEYCFRSENLYLDRDITYILIAHTNSGYTSECRAAGSGGMPQFYLEGSDGSKILLEKE